MKTYREGRCALCGKVRGHPVHDVPPPLRWWQRVLQLPWPSFIHGVVQGAHRFVDRDRRTHAAEDLNRLKQAITKRLARLKEQR
jgi:hypothetical protein